MSFQEFDYEIKDEKVCIQRCFSVGNTAEIPEMLDGYPVVEIAPYAFAEDMKAKEKNGLPQLCGSRLEEIIFPKTMRRIGRYAFYNCNHLRRLDFYNTLMDLGAGAFTGCHKVREISVHFIGNKQSILREFLTELPEEQRLEIQYEDGTAKLLIPEFFEESVENTPARILEIHTHGSGMLYRNCFVKKELDFRLYDENFKYAIGREFPETLFELVFQRVLNPYHLTEKAQKKYIDFLKENLEKCAMWAGEQDRSKEMNYLAEHCAETGQELDILIKAANQYGMVETLSWLMDKKHQKFKVKRKSFEL